MSVSRALTYAEFGASAFAFLPLIGAARVVGIADPTHRRAGRWLRRFGRTTSRLTPLWQFSVEGEAPPDIDRRGYVVVANHASLADPFLLSFLPWDMRWVAKEELFRMPVLGWLMRLGGDVPLRRTSKSSAKEMAAACAETLARGLSVMIFPEGTRSKDGTLRPFKDGAFRLAIETQSPVLPVAVSGTRDCLPNGALAIGRATAKARILSPISTAGMTLDDLPRLRDQARAQIEASLSASPVERTRVQAASTDARASALATNGGAA